MENFSLDDLDTDILDFFSEEIELRQPPEENEFTSKEFWEYVNSKPGVDISRKTALIWLNKAVTEGKATMRPWRSDKGHDTNLFMWVGGGK